ncbi:cysteine hydrolase family protein [Hahella ganghwensis]|uniref:cysteine hydrolase family protein n=1 Tax=Hahella ganghwensis TaxID=286420 RepID=UPI00036294C1|nr:cysteine hydrolase family protein [Hahella ganghwensis]
MFQSAQPALVVIDVQQAIDCYSVLPRNNPDAEQVMSRLLQAWRHHDLPVIHVRHASRFVESPYHPDSQTYTFKPEVSPLAGETIITKNENSAFIGTSLDDQLRALGITELVVSGVLTNNSVDATVRVAAGNGYRCFLVRDAMAACGMALLNGDTLDADLVHEIFLSNLHDEYGQVCRSGDVLRAIDADG